MEIVSHEELAEKLEERGLSFEDSIMAAGVIIEEIMKSQASCYRKGFLDGYEKGQESGIPTIDINTIPPDWSLEEFLDFYENEGFILVDERA